MTDVSVYYFVRHGGPGGKELLSERRATLETIKDRGKAVMQSQRVVDHTRWMAMASSLGAPATSLILSFGPKYGRSKRGPSHAIARR